PVEKWTVRLSGLVLIVIGGGSYIERITDWDLGIDLLLFRHALLATQVPHPGLMAAASGLAFLALGAALLLVDWETPNQRRPAQGLALVAVVIGFISFLGYVYGVQLLYGAAGYSAVAIHTAVLFMLLGTGLLWARPNHGFIAVLTSDRLGGLMARRLMPIFIILPLVVGWLRMRGQRAGLYRSEFGSALFSGGYVIILVILIWVCALWLNRADLARRRAEERDEELASIVESSSDAIIGKTLDGIITSWNRGAEKLYGYTAGEIVGKSISLLGPPGHQDEIPGFLKQIKQGYPVRVHETIRQRKDGTLIFVSLVISPVHDRDGAVIGASSVARDITERKLAEERLNQSQAQLKGIIDSAMDAVITANEQQSIVMFNAAAEKMFGYSADQILGHPLDRLIPTKFRPVHQQHVHNFGNAGVTKRKMGALNAVSGLRGNGEEFPIEASISQIVTGGKRLYTAIIRDVTERERTDRALREQAAVLALTQVLVRDLDDRIVLWNRGAEKLYGFTQQQALGRISHELLRTEFPEPLETIREKLESTSEWEGELVHYKQDGSQIVVASVWTLERDAQGRPYRILEANTDITGRKRAEDAMQLAQIRLQSALASGRMGTWVWDMSKGKIEWDDAMAVLFGRSVEELAEGSIEPFFSWIHPDDRERAKLAIEAALQRGGDYDSEYRIIRPDQSTIWIAARGRMEKDKTGRPFRTAGACIDITDRKKMEEQLLQSQKMQALGTLAGGIAHDFNNILLAIGGNAGLAMEELPGDHPAQVNLQEIAKAGARASNMIRQIITFSRRQSVDYKIIAIQPVIEEALALLRATLPARIEIRTRFSHDLPQIAADSTQLHQIIMNLGTNAAQAIGDNPGILEVTAKTFEVHGNFSANAHKLKNGNYVKISVTDNGCGMDAATMERIFDPFFTTRLPGKGTGLGLSMVHGILKSHEGTVTVYSEPGKGTTFNLYFPAVMGPVTRSSTVEPIPLGSGQHLLYVDDEEALVMLARRTLGKLGYQVTGYTSPMEALQAFKKDPFQFAAVVTDLSMPGMSGAELAREVLQTRPNIPVVMMSGYLRPEDEREARQIGIRELILKPDTVEELAKSLHRVFTESADSTLAPGVN
ncbi:MAG TPA: PAS domain S-box protein, partial [Candidatus Angelobacter sp.]|nr:PAS domain S-box protein [Candidatus Angelobacter sp.]